MIMLADCSALFALPVCGSLNLLEQLFAAVLELAGESDNR